jgi:hypothetical protein
VGENIGGIFLARTVRQSFKADDAFWRCWRDNPRAMKRDGYRVKKINGEWRVWIERITDGGIRDRALRAINRRAMR